MAWSHILSIGWPYAAGRRTRVAVRSATKKHAAQQKEVSTFKKKKKNLLYYVNVPYALVCYIVCSDEIASLVDVHYSIPQQASVGHLYLYMVAKVDCVLLVWEFCECITVSFALSA